MMMELSIEKEIEKEFREVIRIDPNHAEAQEILKCLYDKQNGG